MKHILWKYYFNSLNLNFFTFFIIKSKPEAGNLNLKLALKVSGEILRKL